MRACLTSVLVCLSVGKLFGFPRDSSSSSCGLWQEYRLQKLKMKLNFPAPFSVTVMQVLYFMGIRHSEDGEAVQSCFVIVMVFVVQLDWYQITESNTAALGIIL